VKEVILIFCYYFKRLLNCTFCVLVAYAQIDWHDFVVVETVDYQPYESGNFPPPTTPDEVGARILMEERLNEDDEDIEMQIESDQENSDQEDTIARIKLSQMEDRTSNYFSKNCQFIKF